MTDAPAIASAVLAGMVAFLLIAGAAAMLALFKGASELRRLFRAATSDYSSVLLKSPLVPGVSLLAAAREADEGARGLVRRLVNLHFGRHEVVLALNGPSDAALAQWTEEFHLVREKHSMRTGLAANAVRACYVSREPIKLLVVETERGSEAGALNAAILAAQYPVLGMVDPRAEFIQEWMLHLIRPMLENWEQTAAVFAAAPAPPVPGLAGYFGALEMLRRWMVRGAAFARWGKLAPMPGACMLIKRQAVEAVGGFRRGLTELFKDLNKGKGEISFLPVAVSWSQAPASFGDLKEQTLYDQSRVVAGGWFTTLFGGRVLRPLIETLALLLAGVGLAIGWIPPALALLVLLASVGVGIVLSAGAVVLREMSDPGRREPGYVARLFLSSVPENLGYRQWRNLWLIVGAFK
jgi:cellulose synthase/poly-beta-1,6-N-acetylglucosamine synthase-like glycosyltransferase